MRRSKRWIPAREAKIVLEGLRGETNLAELRCPHGFDQSQFNRSLRHGFARTAGGVLGWGHGSLVDASHGSHLGQPAEKDIRI